MCASPKHKRKATGFNYFKNIEFIDYFWLMYSIDVHEQKVYGSRYMPLHNFLWQRIKIQIEQLNQSWLINVVYMQRTMVD